MTEIGGVMTETYVFTFEHMISLSALIFAVGAFIGGAFRSGAIWAYRRLFKVVQICELHPRVRHALRGHPLNIPSRESIPSNERVVEKTEIIDDDIDGLFIEPSKMFDTTPQLAVRSMERASNLSQRQGEAP